MATKAMKLGKRRDVTGKESVSRLFLSGAPIYKGVRPFILERSAETDFYTVIISAESLAISAKIPKFAAIITNI